MNLRFFRLSACHLIFKRHDLTLHFLGSCMIVHERRLINIEAVYVLVIYLSLPAAKEHLVDVSEYISNLVGLPGVNSIPSHINVN